jgi:hypothetical protein
MESREKKRFSLRGPKRAEKAMKLSGRLEDWKMGGREDPSALNAPIQKTRLTHVAGYDQGTIRVKGTHCSIDNMLD